MTSDATMNISNPQEGFSYAFLFIQDGTGGWEITNWDVGTAVVWPGGVAPTFGADPAAKNLVYLHYVNSTLFGFYTPVTGQDVQAYSAYLAQIVSLAGAESSDSALVFSTGTGTYAHYGLAGADGSVLTGTAGTNGYLPQWNADGDLVDSSVPATVSGADTTVITGTAGSANDIAMWNGDGDLVTVGYSRAELMQESFIIPCSDEAGTDLATGTGVVTFRMPYAFTLTDVRASVDTAPTGANIIVDINEGGSTIMTTNKLSIDATEKTSTTAATAAGITDASLADDAEITIDIDQVGSTETGSGLKVTLIGYQT